MGHDKLRKFAENESFSCLLQPSSRELLADGFNNLHDHPIKGNWFSTHPSENIPASNTDITTPVSSTKAPLILELGCGKGEYTLALARRHPERNYIGVDIKGARLWRGAKTATEEGLSNVAFLRTRIEFINAFFAPGEVSEIWLTFSDPQPGSENRRLSSPLFLERFRAMLKPGGIVRLKTDSLFLHEYTKAVVLANGLPILACTTDLYGQGGDFTDDTLVCSANFAGVANSAGLACYEPATAIEPEVREVKTFYESMFLEQGVPITYLAFKIDGSAPFVHPDRKFDTALWRTLDNARRSFSHKE